MGRVAIEIDETVYVEARDILDQLNEDDLAKELERRRHGRSLKEHERVKELILNQLGSEQVKEIYECIVDSYHYDVFEKI